MKFGILSQSSLRGPRVCRGGRSNPGLLAFFLLFTFLLTPALTFATPQVPRTIVFQGILVDAGGNPLTDVSSANAHISIVDGAGEVRYEEQQTITLYQGATAFLVGTGTSLDTGEPTGGIPLDVMEPGEGDLILKIKIEGQTIAQEDVILASVPFSFYSQYATELTQPIESKQIKDGAITVSHLSEEVTTYVKSLGVSKEELEEHKTEKAAHAATSISVRNTFKNLMGTDLQMLMESVDYNITLANKASQITSGSIDSDDIKDGDVKQVDLDMNTFNGWDKNETDDLTTSTIFGGALYGVYSDLQLVDNSVNTNNIVDGSVTAEKLDESYVKKNGDTIEGDLTIEGNLKAQNNITFDGYKPSSSESDSDQTQSLTINLWPEIKRIYYSKEAYTIPSDPSTSSHCLSPDSKGVSVCFFYSNCSDSKDKILSCNGLYTGVCSGYPLICSLLGSEFASSHSCVTEVAVKDMPIDTTLYVSTICGETYK